MRLLFLFLLWSSTIYSQTEVQITPNQIGAFGASNNDFMLYSTATTGGQWTAPATFLPLSNYWTRTGVNLSYTAGNVRISGAAPTDPNTTLTLGGPVEFTSGQPRIYYPPALGLNAFFGFNQSSGAPGFFQGLGPDASGVIRRLTTGAVFGAEFGRGGFTIAFFALPSGQLAVGDPINFNNASSTSGERGWLRSDGTWVFGGDVYNVGFLSSPQEVFTVGGGAVFQQRVQLRNDLRDVNNFTGNVNDVFISNGANGPVTWASRASIVAGGGAVTTITGVVSSGNANGASISVNNLRLHEATLVTPGIVSVGDQELGSGIKTFSNNVNAAATPLILMNNLANVDTEGTTMEFKGSAPPVLGAISAVIEGGSISGGVSFSLATGPYKGLDMHSGTRITDHNGFRGKDMVTVSGSYDVTAALANRVGIYNINTGGGTLTLPDPTTLPQGTVISWAMTALTGSATTVNTAASGSEFWVQNSLSATPSYSIPTGAVRKGTFEVINISGNKWVVEVSSGDDLAIGAFQTSGTADGLSIASNAVRLHAATATHPGAVTLTDQALGTGTKTVSKHANAISIPLIIENNLADIDDEGAHLQFRGISSQVMGSIISSIEGGSIGGGVVLDILSGPYKGIDMHSLNRVTRYNGFSSKDIVYVSGSYDITAALTNRVGTYNITTGGGTFTLPDPGTIPEGTVIEWAMTALSGSATTVNTSAAGSEFWVQNATAATASYSIPTGVVRQGTFEVFNISGNKWVVAVRSGGDLDQSYDAFGPTPSKINVNASEGQTGGLEFESTGANNIIIDLAGTGDFLVQDNATTVLEVADNGYLSIGTGGPTTAQKVLVTENSSSVVTVPLRVRNNGTDGDGVGVAFTLAINGNDNVTFTSLNPVGAVTNQFLMQVGEGGGSETYIAITPAIKETRFENSTAREVFNGTATTLTLDGRVSVVRVPTSATTTTITLPEIVTGVPGSNQVSIGYELFLIINRAVIVTINRSGADVLITDGGSGSSNSAATTASIIYARRLIATAADEWTIF